MLEMALAAGICSMGTDALFMGGILWLSHYNILTTDMMCDAGAVISASHNPFEDNGIKFFNNRGFKLDNNEELTIETPRFSETIKQAPSNTRHLGRVSKLDDALGRYLVFLKNSLPKETTLKD